MADVKKVKKWEDRSPSWSRTRSTRKLAGTRTARRTGGMPEKYSDASYSSLTNSGPMGYERYFRDIDTVFPITREMMEKPPLKQFKNVA